MFIIVGLGLVFIIVGSGLVLVVLLGVGWG